VIFEIEVVGVRTLRGGRLSARAATSTPGIALSRSIARVQNACLSASPGYRVPGSETLASARARCLEIDGRKQHPDMIERAV